VLFVRSYLRMKISESQVLLNKLTAVF